MRYSIKKYWFSFLGALAIISLLVSGILYNLSYLSEAILAITAIIILWYTWETYQIRKSNQELLYKSKRPVVGYEIFMNNKVPVDTRFLITNLSDYPVAALVKFNFKLGDKEIPNILDAYDGKAFWNLQYKASKEGHFNWPELYSELKLFDEAKIEELKTSNYDEVKKIVIEALIFAYNFESPPKLTIDVEIFCMNDHGEDLYYPPVHYEFDPYRIVWIPNVTSKKPYWKYESEPTWVKSIMTNNKTGKN